MSWCRWKATVMLRSTADQIAIQAHHPSSFRTFFDAFDTATSVTGQILTLLFNVPLRLIAPFFANAGNSGC